MDLDSAIQKYNHDLQEARSSRIPGIPRIRFASEREPQDPPPKTVRAEVVDAKPLPRQHSTPPRQDSFTEEVSTVRQTQSLSTAHERLLGNFSTLRHELSEVLTHLEQQCRLRFQQFTRLKDAIETNRKGLEELYQIKLPPDDIDAILNLRKQKKFELQQELDDAKRRMEADMERQRQLFEKEKDHQRALWEQELRSHEQKQRLAQNSLDQQVRLIEEEKHRLATTKEEEMRQLEAMYRQKYELLKEELLKDGEELKESVNRRRQDWMNEESEYEKRRETREKEEQAFLANLALSRKLDQDLYEAKKLAMDQELEEAQQEQDVQLKKQLEEVNYQEKLLNDREARVAEREREYLDIKEKLATFNQTLEHSLKEATEAHERELNAVEARLMESHGEELAALNQAHQKEKEALEARAAQSQLSQDSRMTEAEHAHDKAVQDLRVEHEEALLAQEKERQQSLGKQKEDHDRVVTLLKDEYEAHIARLKEEQAKALSDMKTEYEQHVKAGEAEHAEFVKVLKEEHEGYVQQLIEDHNIVLKEKSQMIQETEVLQERRQLQLESRVLDLDEENRLLKDRLETAGQRMDDLKASITKRFGGKSSSGDDLQLSPRYPKIVRLNRR